MNVVYLISALKGISSCFRVNLQPKIYTSVRYIGHLAVSQWHWTEYVSWIEEKWIIGTETRLYFRACPPCVRNSGVNFWIALTGYQLTNDVCNFRIESSLPYLPHLKSVSHNIFYTNHKHPVIYKDLHDGYKTSLWSWTQECYCGGHLGGPELLFWFINKSYISFTVFMHLDKHKFEGRTKWCVIFFFNINLFFLPDLFLKSPGFKQHHVSFFFFSI